MVKWIVVIAGGRGPDTWDSEFEVEAEDFSGAYEQANMKVVDYIHSGDFDFVSISQQL